MSNFNQNINELMTLRVKVFKSHGVSWPNSAMTNFTRGTFGVCQLITEAVERAETCRMIESMIFECEHYDRAPVIVIGGFAVEQVFGVSKSGSRVPQTNN